jgi:Transposase IS116/IS110/IS902 family
MTAAPAIARTTPAQSIAVILLERGFAIRKGRRAPDAAAEIRVSPADRTSGRMHRLIGEMQAEREALDHCITALDREFLQRAGAVEAAPRLVIYPGIGVPNATALLAACHAMGSGRGRDLAAWLGLVPCQHTRGGRPKLLGMTKRCNKYMRMLLYAHAVICACCYMRMLLYAHAVHPPLVRRCPDAPSLRPRSAIGSEDSCKRAPDRRDHRARQQACPHRLATLRHDSSFDPWRLAMAA